MVSETRHKKHWEQRKTLKSTHAHTQNKIKKNTKKIQLNIGTIFQQALHKTRHRLTRKQRRDCPNSVTRDASLNYSEISVNIYQNSQNDFQYRELEKMDVELLTAGGSVNWYYGLENCLAVCIRAKCTHFLHSSYSTCIRFPFLNNKLPQTWWLQTKSIQWLTLL